MQMIQQHNTEFFADIYTAWYTIIHSTIAKPQKSYIFLVARPLRPYPLSSPRVEKGTNFDQKKSPQIFGLKEPYFLPNIATNLSKNNDFANSFKKVIFLVAGPLKGGLGKGLVTKKRTFFETVGKVVVF